MSKLISCLILFVALSAFAEDIQILKMTTHGRKCRGQDVQLLQNGNAFSLLFNRFAIELNAGESTNGYAEVETCVVTLDIRLPADRCLEQVDQVFSGGILKSSRSRGSLLIAYNIHGVYGQALKQWRLNNPINPEDADSIFSINFSKRPRPSCIKGRVRYTALIIMEAFRYSLANDHFLSQIDSNDAELFLRLR